MARFRQSRLTHYGRAPTFALSSPPLLPYQLLCRRGFDALVSAIALLLLAPVFAAIAVAIKLDSEGPVFFRQRRRGYNQREFLIWKFRTMTVMDDGDTIVQAQRNDGRVTRVGRYLRSLNLDELPQLINVIAGDMSLVGPRPHAVAHDRHFEPRIRRYARRLNVKPGITGWAQVNGYRGLTETENDMKNRIVHDLYYIENWSIAFDVYILIRTVLSPRAYRNAF
jgi:exopolysaccharide biosynthesis polyprenyl glycosylphosphotransferase